MGLVSGTRNAIGRLIPFKRGAQPSSASPTLQATPAPSSSSSAAAANGQATGNVPQVQEDQGSIQLVNYTPEQLVEHVEQDIARIQFGWTFTTKWMEGFAEVWSWVGPIVLVLGTIGEVFLVLWLRQRTKDLLAGLSIVAVALVLECTFLSVSYKAATIRNRAERRPGGPTPLDKKKLHKQFAFWFALGIGVCATQVIFVAAQTRASIPGEGGDIGVIGVWIFAILRAIFTLVADGYTAFAHEEKPTTGEQVLEEREQRAKITDRLLQQKRREITLINDGILDVREASVEAQIKDDKMTTRLTLERMQNEGQIKALATQQETADLTIKMLMNLQRALLDPTMPADQRQIAINTMIAMGEGYRQLVVESGEAPPPQALPPQKARKRSKKSTGDLSTGDL